MDVAEWLRGAGLEQYAPAFRDNDIDWEVLRRLTAEDLRELGVASVGHRRRLLDAIVALGNVSAAEAPARSCRVVSCPCRGRAASADGDVLRSGRFDGAVGAVRSRGSARDDRRLPP